MNFDDIKNKITSLWREFDTNEQVRNRVLVVFLVFIGVVSVFVGFSNTKNNIKNPFYDEEKDAISSIYDTYNELKKTGKLIEDDSSNNSVNNSANKNNPLSVDHNDNDTDTDGDGLSNYDETNIFKTSIFLSDSDGDGFSDFDEIKNGTDANCAVGKNCSIQSDNIVAENKSDINNNDINKINIESARKELEKIIPDSLKPMLDDMTDDQVRSLLSQLYEATNSTDNLKNTETKIENNAQSNYVSLLKSKLPNFTVSQLDTIRNMDEVSIKKLLLDSNIADNSLLSQFKTGELKSTILGE